jgi:hypothetical protein
MDLVQIDFFMCRAFNNDRHAPAPRGVGSLRPRSSLTLLLLP